jgi:hypothetical protein
MNTIFDFILFNQLKVIIFSSNNLKCKSVIFKVNGVKNEIILIINLLLIDNFENIIIKDKASNIIVGDK